MTGRVFFYKKIVDFVRKIWRLRESKTSEVPRIPTCLK